MVVAKMKRALLMVPVALCCAVAASLAPLPASAAACEFLSPIGGNGDGPKPWIVKKRIERTKGLLGRTNWNTDFSAAKPYGSYKLFFTADSTDGSAQYPIEAYLKFADGSNLRVVDQSMQPPIGTGRMFGPFPAVAGKLVTQVNFKVGTSKDPGATGFSYRISVQGCQ